ncbi:MAG TPA: hypothetical protein H9715_00940, partial [Candidatus Merdibacter merdigallinarum]|nr:hypothetical protein [Candidatus Merdibacter merdigallinarum]
TYSTEKPAIIGRNLPLQRISVAVLPDYDTISRLETQGAKICFLQEFSSLFLCIFTRRFSRRFPAHSVPRKLPLYTKKICAAALPCGHPFAILYLGRSARPVRLYLYII